MSDSLKTLEDLSCSQTTNDMWRELSMDINPDRVLIDMRTFNNVVTLRFLGPFVSTRRIYASVLKQNNMDVEAVINRDPTAMKRVDTYIAEYESKKMMLEGRNKIPASNPITVFITEQRIAGQRMGIIDAEADCSMFYKNTERCLKNLREIKEKITWQRCLLVNACYRYSSDDPVAASPHNNDYSGFGIFVITRTIADAISQAVRNNTNEAISGPFAHDITLRKSGEGFQTNYMAEVAPMSHLSDRMIKEILVNGLIDIPAFMALSNGRKNSPYYYRLSNGYKMSMDLLPEIMQASKGFEERAHFASVEKHINDLPDNAIENRQNMKNAFGGIEIDLSV